MNLLFLKFLIEVVFLTVVLLHIIKKNNGAVLAYSVQSLAIVAMLFNSFHDTGNILLFFVALLALIVKVILSFIFFSRLIKKNGFKFLVSTYLNTPLTLICIALLTAIASSSKFAPLTEIIPANKELLTFALSSIFLSLFLIVNRKGALSQIVGILSFENSIVAFTLFAGLEQSASLQIGIIFDIFVWLIIATVFVSMIYKHFGTLNVTSMKNLKE